MILQKKQLLIFAIAWFVLAVIGPDLLPGQDGEGAQRPTPENPVFDIPTGITFKEGELPFLVEIIAGSSLKHEFHTASGVLFLDRTLCPRPVLGTALWTSGFPENYGISPGRFNVDGDPLDLVVLGSNEKYHAMIEARAPKAQNVRVVGIIKMQECDDPPCRADEAWEDDWKVVAVDQQDEELSSIGSISDIDHLRLEAIHQFASNYKGSVNGHPKTRVHGIIERQSAIEYIRDNFPVIATQERQAEVSRCRSLYAETYAGWNKNQLQTEKNPEYINCLGRVDYDGFRPGTRSFDFFLRYNALQWVHKLDYQPGPGEEKPDLDNSFAVLAQLKKQGQTYYRFIAVDPSPPGTGQRVNGWIQTKNRNVGCPSDFPKQHYDFQPVIDVDGLKNADTLHQSSGSPDED